MRASRAWAGWAAALVLPLAGLWHGFSRQAETFFLEIPVGCAQPVATELFVNRGGGYNDYDYSLCLVMPGQGRARLQLPRDLVKGLCFRIQGAPAGAIAIGQPAVRCAADAALGFSTGGPALHLGAALPGTQARSQGPNRMEIVMPGGAAGEPGCFLELGGPLMLKRNSGTLLRDFGVAALVYILGLAVVWQFRRRIEAWLQAPGFADALYAPFARTAPPRWESRVVAALLLAGGVLQLNAVLHGGTMGQDWANNRGLSQELMENPGKALNWSATNPPGYYYIASLLMRAGGERWGEQLIGVSNLLLNLAALWLFHRLAVRFIRDPVWRVGLMTLATFLPVRLIHTVVLAADALTLLPVFLLGLLLIRLLEKPSVGLGVSASVTLMAGSLIKFTFMSALVAAALVFIQGYRRGTFSARQAVGLGLLVVLPPALLALAQVSRHRSFEDTMISHALPMPNHFPVRRMFVPSAEDAIIFDAPPYNAVSGLPPEVQAANGLLNYELLIGGRHSYPALLHLGVFTDMMNIFQSNPQHTLTRWTLDPAAFYFGQRETGPQSLMVAAVGAALPLTLTCIAALALLGVGAIWRGVLMPRRGRAEVEVALLLALGWFGNIAAFLPLVGRAYALGFWVPRLILPALMLFLLLTFFVLDRLASRSAARVVLACVTLQAALHVSFLWSTETLY